MTAGVEWFWVGKGVACCPAKNGGTSFYRSAFEIGPRIHDRHVFSEAKRRAEAQFRGPYSKEEVLKLQCRKFLAVRDPEERFLSLWREKCVVGDPNIDYLENMTQQQLAQYISDMPDYDKHWGAQSDSYVEGSGIVPYKRFLEVLGLPIIYANVTPAWPSNEICPDVAGWIRAFYAADFELWEKAQCFE